MLIKHRANVFPTGLAPRLTAQALHHGLIPLAVAAVIRRRDTVFRFVNFFICCAGCHCGKILLVIRSYRYRIYPTKSQAATLTQHLAICCELYNAALQERRDAWKLERKPISWFDQIRQVKEIRVLREDVAQVSYKALETTLRRVDLAFQSFFQRVKRGERAGYPRFKATSRYDSLTFLRVGALNGQWLRLPRVGLIKVNLHRPIVGRVKALDIKREGDRWFVVFICETEREPLPFSSNTIGIDVGLAAFATLSTGETVDNPRWYRKAQKQLRIAQRRVARRVRGSKRRAKAVLLIQRAHAAIRNQRADFQHKLSRRLINDNGLIAVEDLNVKGLASGMLAKSVNDAAWEDAGRLLIKVDPRGTSQTCTCGATVRKTLADRWHLCLNCGLSANRDHVSAQVILERGLRFQASTWPVTECVA